jgi:hypothetical protein
LAKKLTQLDREGTWKLLRAAIAFIEERGDPMDAMVNQVVEVTESGKNRISPLPSSRRLAHLLIAAAAISPSRRFFESMEYVSRRPATCRLYNRASKMDVVTRWPD